ncbi:MAG: hypothetical protein H0W88_04115 [Parachlamydiaceae bacterium]|nr:hypothetical protein [Parachlamydiaceae bacterium]
MTSIPPPGPPVPYTNSSLFLNLPPNIEASLVQYLTPQQLDELFNPANKVNLSAPKHVSTLDYLMSIAEAATAFNIQLHDRERADNLAPTKSGRNPGSQSAVISNLYAQRAAALASMNAQLSQDIVNINTQYELITASTAAEQNLINSVNSGRENDTTAVINLLTARSVFIATIKDTPINADVTDLDITDYNEITLNTGADTNAYNDARTLYRSAMTTFGTYWDGRATTVDAYNNSVSAYNTEAAQHNTAIKAILDTYGLTFPQPTLPQQMTISSYPNASNPSDSDFDGSAFTAVHSPESYITGIPLPTHPPLSLPGIPVWMVKVANLTTNIPDVTFSSVDFLALGQQMYDKSYAANIAPIDAKISSAQAAWSLYRMYTFLRPVQTDAVDPFELASLNGKGLLRQILPDAVITEKNPMSGASTIEAIDAQVSIEFIHSMGILGEALYRQIINQTKSAQSELQQGVLSDRFKLLTGSLFGISALQGIVPSLSPIANSYHTLPLNSPAFALLYATSVSNRVQEAISSNSTGLAVKALIENTPELKNLDEASVAALINSVNIALVATSTRLLAENLGLPGLTSQVLAPLVPSNSRNELLALAAKESIQNSNKLREGVEASFLSQGLPPQEAQYIGQLAADLVSNGAVSAPTLTTVNSTNVQTDFLKRSVAAKLVLSNYNLDTAKTTAENAVRQTLAEGPFASLVSFSDALEANLRRLGVKKVANQVAAAAIVIPKEEPLLGPLTQPSTGTAPSEKQLNKGVHQGTIDLPAPQLGAALSENQLIKSVHQRTIDLLVPQLGAEVAEHVSQEVAKTLFGTPTPDSADRAYLKSPNSLSNTLKSQVQQLTAKNEFNFDEGRAKIFKDSIKESVDLSVYLQKIMSPANIFLYSATAGIMYSGKEPSTGKKSIDIQV